MRMKTVMGLVAGVVGMVAAVAAQQPAAAPMPTPAAVIETLTRSAAPPTAVFGFTKKDEPSMAAVLARYEKVIAAGVAQRPDPGTAQMPLTDDALDAVRADLQAIVGRLAGLANKDGQ